MNVGKYKEMDLLHNTMSNNKCKWMGYSLDMKCPRKGLCIRRLVPYEGLWVVMKLLRGETQ